MRCKENNDYSDISQIYIVFFFFFNQCNLLRTFISKTQKCFKGLISN